MAIPSHIEHFACLLARSLITHKLNARSEERAMESANAAARKMSLKSKTHKHTKRIKKGEATEKKKATIMNLPLNDLRDFVVVVAIAAGAAAVPYVYIYCVFSISFADEE